MSAGTIVIAGVGYTRRHTLGDGDCFLHSVGLDPRAFHETRRRVSRLLLTQPARFTHALEDAPGEGALKTEQWSEDHYEEHAVAVAQRGCWFELESIRAWCASSQQSVLMVVVAPTGTAQDMFFVTRAGVVERQPQGANRKTLVDTFSAAPDHIIARDWNTEHFEALSPAVAAAANAAAVKRTRDDVTSTDGNPFRPVRLPAGYVFPAAAAVNKNKNKMPRYLP